MKTGSKLPRRALATGLAVCAHLVVLLLLGWNIPRFAVVKQEDGFALQITLLHPEVPLRGEPSPPRPKPEPASPPPPAPAQVLTQPAPQAPVTTAPQPSTPAPVPSNVETNPSSDNVRNALRGLIGCTGALAARLSYEERATCARKLAAAKPAPVGPLYTAKEAETFDGPNKESIFVRKPHNECLPHIGAGKAQQGTSSAAATTFGLACEWDFW